MGKVDYPISCSDLFPAAAAAKYVDGPRAVRGNFAPIHVQEILFEGINNLWPRYSAYLKGT